MSESVLDFAISVVFILLFEIHEKSRMVFFCLFVYLVLGFFFETVLLIIWVRMLCLQVPATYLTCFTFHFQGLFCFLLSRKQWPATASSLEDLFLSLPCASPGKDQDGPGLGHLPAPAASGGFCDVGVGLWGDLEGWGRAALRGSEGAGHGTAAAPALGFSPSPQTPFILRIYTTFTCNVLIARQCVF